ncbi:MAG: hypothetical protein HY361_04220 [Candidatus Aenigmarchaeota archaeon]|nr:hypothetical protein [Candidatus Aenigmarchaeota archaeon]
MKVKRLKIRGVLATNSHKTIEVELQTERGSVRASVPIGTSRGKYEVSYLPVDRALLKFDIIKRHFTAEQLADQKEADELLRIVDKTPDFKEIGGNLALAISSVFLKAFALENNQEVFQFLSPKPSMPKPISIVAGGWKGQSDIQEFHFLPVHQKSFSDSMSKIASAYFAVADKLKEHDKNFKFSKNLESGWFTTLHYEKLLEILARIANEHLLKIGLDFAASQIWDGRDYVYSDGRKLTSTQQIELMENLAKTYPIIFIEDPFHEDDYISFSTLTHRLQNKLVCGDDIFSTNLQRLKYGILHNATNAILIKPNQIGTITDTIKVVEEAKRNKLTTVMSHRSSECDDVLVAHLAVGLNCDYVKFGISGDRVIKLNEMIRIEEKISS